MGNSLGGEFVKLKPVPARFDITKIVKNMDGGHLPIPTTSPAKSLKSLPQPRKKVDKTKLKEALLDPELASSPERLAAHLKVSYGWAKQLLWRARNEIRDTAIEVSKTLAMRQVHNLARNSDKRDTRAAQILLEMAKAYIPNAKPAPDNQVSVGIVIMPTQLRAGAPLDVHAEIVENEKLKSGGPE
jgi:hypothetical protein